MIADVQRNAEIADFERLLDRLAFEDVESAQRREIYLIRDQILLNAEGYAGSLMGQLAATYAQRYRDAGRLAEQLARLYTPELSDRNLARALTSARPADTADTIEADLRSAYRRREEFIGSGALRDMEPRIALAVQHANWRQQLLELEAMHTACGFTYCNEKAEPRQKSTLDADRRCNHTQLVPFSASVIGGSPPSHC